jgi:DNA topoisomerase-1
VALHGQEIELDFPGKGGKVWRGAVLSRRVAKVVAECAGIPGYRLFKYRDAHGQAHTVGSADINRWLHELTGNADLTAKDFRTWHACTLFIDAALKQKGEEAAALKPLLQAVASELGNTPAILQKSYIHPNLIDIWRETGFQRPGWRRLASTQIARHLHKTEALFLRWLQKQYGVR